MATKVLILCDDPRSETELGDQVRAAGGWIAATASPTVAREALGGIELIVADLRGFDAFETLADISLPIIAQIDADAVDAATALLPEAYLLIGPDPIDRAAAIAVVLANGRDGTVREGVMPDLRQLSEEAGRIARALAHLASKGSMPAHPSSPAAHPAPAITASYVRALIRKRRLRDRFFAAEIFADPAWDMLLDLYAARLEGGQVAVSSLCIAAHVPPTTALRWIRALTEQGLFVRVADPADRRRMFIALSEGAADRMVGYFALSQG